jgi:glycerate kinase
LDADGQELINLPESLVDLHEVDISQLDQRISNCEIIVLCDVDNKLLGENGAAAVFGPQKGADAYAVKKLDAALTRWTDITRESNGKDMAAIKYGGAAGGASSGVYAYLNARLVNGIDHFLKLTGFDEALAKSDLVITGEGSIDEQTLQGKGPFGVASKAKLKDLPVIALAGKVPPVENKQLSAYFNVLLAIGNEPADITSAIKNTEQNLVRTAKEITKLIALGIPKG